MKKHVVLLFLFVNVYIYIFAMDPKNQPPAADALNTAKLKQFTNEEYEQFKAEYIDGLCDYIEDKNLHNVFGFDWLYAIAIPNFVQEYYSEKTKQAKLLSQFQRLTARQQRRFFASIVFSLRNKHEQHQQTLNDIYNLFIEHIVPFLVQYIYNQDLAADFRINKDSLLNVMNLYLNSLPANDEVEDDKNIMNMIFKDQKYRDLLMERFSQAFHAYIPTVPKSKHAVEPKHEVPDQVEAKNLDMQLHKAVKIARVLNQAMPPADIRLNRAVQVTRELHNIMSV